MGNLVTPTPVDTPDPWSDSQTVQEHMWMEIGEDEETRVLWCLKSCCLICKL